MIKNKNKYLKIVEVYSCATFKENCPDFRNSKTTEIYSILKSKKYEFNNCRSILIFRNKNKFDCTTDQKNSIQIKSFQ